MPATENILGRDQNKTNLRNAAPVRATDAVLCIRVCELLVRPGLLDDQPPRLLLLHNRYSLPILVCSFPRFAVTRLLPTPQRERSQRYTAGHLALFYRFTSQFILTYCKYVTTWQKLYTKFLPKSLVF